MASKLWEKNTEVNQEIEKFTVGRDRELDLYLARYDVLGSMAHITMLESIGLLGKDEQPVLLEELRRIHADIEAGRFIIEEGVEDVHCSSPVNWATWGKRFIAAGRATTRSWWT